MIDLNVNYVAFLHRSEHMIEDALLVPAVGVGVNRVPVAEIFR